MEGKNPLHHIANPIVDLDSPGLGQRLPVLAHHLEAQVKQKELLEDESALSRSQRSTPGRPGRPLASVPPAWRGNGVRATPGKRSGRPCFSSNRFRNRVRDVRLQSGHGAMDDGAQRPGGQFSHPAVDRYDPPGMDRRFRRQVHEFPFRIQEHRAVSVVVAANLPEENQPLPVAEDLLKVGLIEELDRQRSRPVLHHHLEDPDLLHRGGIVPANGDLTLHQGVLSDLKLVHEPEAGTVLVAKRLIVEEILHGADLGFQQHGGPGRPHSLHVLNRPIQPKRHPVNLPLGYGSGTPWRGAWHAANMNGVKRILAAVLFLPILSCGKSLEKQIVDGLSNLDQARLGDGQVQGRESAPDREPRRRRGDPQDRRQAGSKRPGLGSLKRYVWETGGGKKWRRYWRRWTRNGRCGHAPT